MRPLSIKTIIPCRTDRSILKVMVTLFSQSPTALLHCCHRGCRLRKMQRGGHMQGTETKGLGENWMTKIREVPDFRESKRIAATALR
jgi:hypothetical protein